MRIKELSLNPGDAFSSGFKKSSQSVDKAFTPSQWGKGSNASEPSSGSAKSNKPTKPTFGSIIKTLIGTSRLKPRVINILFT